MDQISTASYSIDTGKVEELSTYIDRVEQQIKKIRTEAAAAAAAKPNEKPIILNSTRAGADSALAVADLAGPARHHTQLAPLTERQMPPSSGKIDDEDDGDMRL